MKSKTLSVCLLVTLAGCATVQQETSASLNKVSQIISPHQGDAENNRPKAQPRYCYKTMQDVLCYDRPIPGEEERLTGYQEANGKTGYTLPAHRHQPPDIAEKESLPMKPVTPPTPAPGGVPDPSKHQLKEVIFDPAELEPKTLVPDKEQ